MARALPSSLSSGLRRGKRISARVENIVHSVGFIILLAVMVLITYQDLVRWITGKSLYYSHRPPLKQGN